MAKKILLYVPLTLLSVFVLVVAVMWIEHKAPLTLPVLPGAYPVGRVIYDWIDSSRIDSAAPRPGVKRELMVWIWYPAGRGTDASRPAPYLPDPLARRVRAMQGFVMGELFTSDPSAVRTHSVEQTNLVGRSGGAGGTARYPVVLMNSGIGALAADYTTYAESLAAAGYIVVGCDRPYSTFVVAFPNGRVVQRSAAGHPSEAGDPANFDRLVRYWSRDEHFILDKLQELDKDDPSGRFTGRIDLDHVGVLGHSFGGATAMQFSVDDPRCKAAVNLDGQPFGSVVTTGTSKPLLVLTGEHGREPDSVTGKIMGRIARIVRGPRIDGDSGDSVRARGDSGVMMPVVRAGHYWYEVRGAYHFNFSDMALTKEKWLARIAGATGSIGSRRGLEVTAGCLRTFFDVYLKGAPKGVLDSLGGRYPELGSAGAYK